MKSLGQQIFKKLSVEKSLTNISARNEEDISEIEKSYLLNDGPKTSSKREPFEKDPLLGGNTHYPETKEAFDNCQFGEFQQNNPHNMSISFNLFPKKLQNNFSYTSLGPAVDVEEGPKYNNASFNSRNPFIIATENQKKKAITPETFMFYEDSALEVQNLRVIVDHLRKINEVQNKEIENLKERNRVLQLRIENSSPKEKKVSFHSSSNTKTNTDNKHLETWHNKINMVNSEYLKNVLEKKSEELERLKNKLESIEKEKDSLVATKGSWLSRESEYISVLAKLKQENVAFQNENNMLKKLGQNSSNKNAVIEKLTQKITQLEIENVKGKKLCNKMFQDLKQFYPNEELNRKNYS